MPEEIATIVQASVGATRYVDVDGIYVMVTARLQPLVRLLAEGASEEALRRSIENFKPGQDFSAAELRHFLEKLFTKHGLKVSDAVATTGVWRLESATSHMKSDGFDSAIRCRVTLLPEAAANRVASMFKGLYSRNGGLLSALFLLLAATAYVHQFGGRSLSLGVLFQSLRNASALSLTIAAAALLFSAVFHELGHCSAVTAAGLPVGRIGFGIYWVSPALFSDVSAAWTLKRRLRVMVDSGGIYFQVLLCSAFAVVAVITTYSDVQLGFQLAIVLNIITIISAVNPIMKCDGYWIVSDALGLPNLRRQSERAMGDLVRSMFRLERRNPSAMDKRRFLLGYALVSLLFSMAMLVAFALIIRQNAQVALFFPQEFWLFVTSTSHSTHLGEDMARLSLDLVRVLPILFAPIALLTAVSGVTGFLGRTFKLSNPSGSHESILRVR